jgi:hypothetical protein
MSRTPSGDLASRLFNRPWFVLAWAVLLAVLVARFWRVRDAFLVWWVYGRNAYFHGGIRVLPGNPGTFTAGELAPQWPESSQQLAFSWSLSGLRCCWY